MSILWQDLRFIARSGWTPSNRSTTLVVILTLALGIGATVSIFSVVEGVLLRPLAVREPERLVYVQLTTAEARESTVYGRIAKWDLYAAWRAESAVFEELAAYSMTMPVLTEMGPARRVQAVAVSSNMFGFLGAAPKLGRTFAPDEEVPGVAPAVILSHSFWVSNFGSDPEVLGGGLTLDGRRFEIVGVMPSRFRIPFSIPEVRQAEAEVWIPMGAYLPVQRSAQAPPPGVNVLGRLQRGVTPRDAQVRLDRSIAEGALAAGAAATLSHVTHVVPLRRVIVGQVRTPLLMLMAAALLVLLIACGNVVNLLLARALVRQREVSLRLALGAARERIFRQFLTEAVVLAVVGGGTGVLLAWYGTPLLLQLAQNRLPHTGDIGINATVLGAASCVSVLTGVATGLVPALRAMRSVSFAGLREARPRPGTSAWSNRASDVLVVVEIALTMIMVSSMVLLTRSNGGVLRHRSQFLQTVRFK